MIIIFSCFLHLLLLLHPHLHKDAVFRLLNCRLIAFVLFILTGKRQNCYQINWNRTEIYFKSLNTRQT
jgi:hypothetical protein